MINLFKLGFVAALLSTLMGCSSTDHAVFVTVTDVGISGDATAQRVNIGYDRSEGFIGPVYVEKGTVPQVVGYLQSNLQVFSPKIKQLYATGKAAGLVTQNQDPDITPVESPDASGERRVMFFGTSSSIGLGFSFSAGAPDSIHFGYHRKELSIIPFLDKDPTGSQKDTYASTLASIDMDQTTGSINNTSLGVSQFIATGAAAENLAKRPEIRSIFKEAATTATSQGASDAQNVIKNVKSVTACVNPNGGAFDAAASTRLNKILAAAVSKNGLPQANATFIGQATTTDDLQSRITDAVPTAAPILQTTINQDSSLCN